MRVNSNVNVEVSFDLDLSKEIVENGGWRDATWFMDFGWETHTASILLWLQEENVARC